MNALHVPPVFLDTRIGPMTDAVELVLTIPATVRHCSRFRRAQKPNREPELKRGPEESQGLIRELAAI
jgi:hypothetical protein